MQLNIMAGKLKGLWVMKLIQWFLTEKYIEGREDKWQYVAHILQNVTQTSEGRALLVSKRKLLNPILYRQTSEKYE